jgi:hypothetical protein
LKNGGEDVDGDEEERRILSSTIFLSVYDLIELRDRYLIENNKIIKIRNLPSELSSFTLPTR